MAQRTITTVTDDIDGSPDARAVSFAFEGVSYSIDLSAANRERLADALAPFIEHASQESRTNGRRSPATATWRREELQEWAKDNGYKVGDRGRVPQSIVDEFLAAR